MGNKYVESQSFITKWLVLLLLVLLGFEIYSCYKDYLVTGIFSVGVAFWILLVVFIGFLFMRLKIVIDGEGITINFFPFALNKQWKWEDMEAVYVEEYSLMDYGGWGYRLSSKGTAYTTKGKFGIQIVLKDNKRYLIGTQNPDEVKFVLSKFFKAKNEE